MNDKTLIMKFGGASLASSEQFSLIADLIIQRSKEFPRIVIVVSAMGKTTDDLVTLAKTVHPNPPRREYDMLLTVGERISMALLAMSLSLREKDAISYTGSQSGIITSTDHSEAKIIDIRPQRLINSLDQGKIVIVAGFQGVSRLGEITTLGRGGSDTTAVALAIALKAELVEFYKDVPGIFSEDPKKNANATHLKELSYQEALAIIEKGAKVLHDRCIKLAWLNQIPLHILSFKNGNASGTKIGGLPISERPSPIFEFLKEPCLSVSH